MFEWMAKGFGISQYGYRNFFARAGKSILRKAGIDFQKHVILKRTLDKKLIPVKPKIEINVRKLNLQDLETASHFNFPKDKLDIFKKRLDDSSYVGLGAFTEGKLTYLCWLSLEIFESSVDLGGRISLDSDEGLLLDAVAHPDYKGLGIHSYMNAVRLNRLIDLGRKRAIVMVMFENTPAMKSQAKAGFRPECLIYYRKIFRKVSIRWKYLNS